MKPIYFPHTYITDETFEALTVCFQKIMVYQPTLRHIPESMLRWRDTEQLEIRCPVSEFERDIESLLKSYQHLGETHQGRRGEVQNYQPSGIPFFDGTSPQKIRTDLIREIRGDAPQRGGFTPSAANLIHAGLFLQLAQNLDQHQDEIRRNMAACAGMEKNLFKNLKEDDELLFQERVSPPLPSANSPGEHRLQERFSAWTRLFFYDVLVNHKEEKFPALPLLFITTSRFLFDEIVTDGKDNAISFSLDPLVFGQPAIKSTLTEMARATDPASFRKTLAPYVNETPMAIRTAVVLNESPLAFLGIRAGLSPGEAPNFPDRELQPNTLISLIST